MNNLLSYSLLVICIWKLTCGSLFASGVQLGKLQNACSKCLIPDVRASSLVDRKWLKAKERIVNVSKDVSLNSLRESFIDLPNLKWLELPQQSDDSVVLALKGLPNLETLDLRGTRVTVQGLANLQNFPRLNNIFTPQSIDDEWLPTIGKISGLTQLKIGGTEHQQVTGNGLKNIGSLHALEELVIRSSDIIDEDFQYLSTLESLRRLSIFHDNRSPYGSTIVSGDGLKYLGKLEKLKALHMEGIKFSTSGLRTLSQLRLEDLHLVFLGFPDGALAQIGTMKSLTSITLDASDFSEIDAEHFVKGLANLKNLPSLKNLSLLHLRLPSGSTSFMTEIKGLGYLSLSGNTNISKNEVKALAQKIGMKVFRHDPSGMSLIR